MDIIVVQEYWNSFKIKLINIVDKNLPSLFLSNKVKESREQQKIKNKQNVSQRPLKINLNTPQIKLSKHKLHHLI
jgi:hypothetical protein